MSSKAHVSREGHVWTQETGLQSGLPSIGVIKPPSNRPSDRVHDVVVIGAGYAGLTAVRDLTIAGHDVLLLEGRDRIGGRTWSSDIEGYPYEMGGTWVHWNQPFIWRELARYGMSNALESSHVRGQGLEQAWLNRPDGSVTKLSVQEEFNMLESALKKFVNIDGNFGRDAIPLAHNALYNPITAEYDKLSFADRLAQIRDYSTPIELEILELFLSVTSGGTMQESSFLDFLRWWALNNYDLAIFKEACLTFKLKDGQSAMARQIFDEAIGTGRVTYQFDAPVASVKDEGAQVVVTTRAGVKYRAKRAISTIPLNVLKDVLFEPPLLPGKRTASEMGHANHCVKVHAEVSNPSLRSFAGWNRGALGMAFGDGTTPAGNTHIVAFGCSYPDLRLEPTAADGREAVEAMSAFAPGEFGDIRRVVFHDWNGDEFARGTWEFLRPGMATEYLDVLRERQGNVLFASADWAMGWRGFIDGAVEDGARAAKELDGELRSCRQGTP